MRRKRILLSIIGLTVVFVLGPLVYFGLFKPHKSTAAWFNDSWGYRKAVDITNSSGSNLNEFQVSINIGTSANIVAGKMKSDCSDIRITDVNGDLLPHWIEENNPGCNAATDAKVWVKVHSIPTSGGTVYVYYGNPSASNIASGDKVFEFFDDFNDGDYSSKWETHTISHSVGANNLETLETSGQQKINGSTGVDYDRGKGFRSIKTFTAPLVYEIQRVSITPVGDRAYGYIHLYHSNSYWLGYGGGIGYSSVANKNGRESKINDAVTYSDDLGGSDDYGFRTYKIVYDGSTATFYIDDQNIVSNTAPGLTSIKVGTATWLRSATSTIDVRFDNARVRKYASTNPSSSLSSTEEVSKAPSAYWKFDEGQGIVAQDSSSNRNNGTLGAGTSAPAWQTEDMCISGKCLKFDGNDFVSIGSTALNVQTISFWVKPTTTTQNFIDLDNGTHYISVSSGTVSATGFSSPTIYVNGISQTSPTSLTANAWNHIEVTTATSFNATSIKLGQRTTNFLTGFLDEVKLFSYARSVAEIKADYNTGKGKAGTAKGSAVHLGGGGDSSEVGGLSQGLVGYWKMDENTGTTTADSSGNSNTGTLGTGGSAPGWVSGLYGVGLSFDGADDFVRVSSLDTPFSPVTFSIWIKPVNMDGETNLIGNLLNTYTQHGWGIKWEGPYTTNYIRGLASGDSFTWWNNLNFRLNTIPLNSWTHLVVTFDAPAMNQMGTGKIYKNGQLMASYYALTGSRGDGFSIGGNATGGFTFNGIIDEARVYNRALSPAEVRNLYNWAPGPVAYFPFDENQGNTVYNQFIGGNNATLGTGNATPSWVPGKYGSALYFDGSDYASFTRYSNLNSAGGITYEAWVYMNPLTPSCSRSDIINNYNTNGRAYSLYYETSCGEYGLSFDLIQNDGTSIGTQRPLGTNNLTETKKTWYHLAGTYDGTTEKLYINGVLINSASFTGTLLPLLSSSAIYIGNYSGSSRYFTGIIDELKIYNYARTAKQIIEDMQGSHPAVASAKEGALASYHFDEGYGTVVNNSGSQGSSLQGSLGAGASAPSWSNDGKFGKTLSFDGGGDYAATANTAMMAGAGQTYPTLAISAWVYPQTSAVSKTILNKNSEFKITTDANSKANCSIYANGSWQSSSISSSNLSLNSWSHVLCNFDGTTLKTWVNGIGGIGVGYTGQLTSTSSTPLNIAKDATALANYQGLIDEVKIYNYSLSQDEILTDFNSGSSLILGSLSSGSSNPSAPSAGSQEYCIPGDTTTNCSPPVGRWDFNEGVGTSAYDTSGNSNNGVLGTGSSAPTWATGKFGKALKFDGVDDLVTTTISSTGNWTIEFWGYMNNYPPVIQSPIGPASSGTIGIFMTYTANKWGMYDGSSLLYGSVLLPKTWYHLTVQNNSNVYTLFLNGKKDGSGTLLDIDITNMKIGQKSDGGWPFPGRIDNVRVFNYARSPAQIAWDYNLGDPIAWYRFDECQGTTLSSMTNPYNPSLNLTLNVGGTLPQTTAGTCGIGSTISSWSNGATGKYNASLNFDGQDDYAVTSNLALIAGAGQSSPGISWGGWIKPSTTVVSKTIINKNSEFKLTTDANSYANCSIYANGGWQTAAVSSSLFSLSTWSHVLCTYDGTNIKVYINGENKGNQGNTGSILSLSSTPLNIGRDPTAIQYFEGQIDEVRVWNYPLTGEQVKMVYNQGAGIRFGPDSGTP